MAYYTRVSSPFGKITLLTYDGEALGGLWLASQNPQIHDAEFSNAPEIFRRTEGWLKRYFAGGKPICEEIPRDLHGTAFQQRVWERLCEIPYGATVSYGQIATEIGCRSAQAVGQAVGRNPVSIIVPCHRVIGRDGSLTGYAGGLEYKRELLKLEGILG